MLTYLQIHIIYTIPPTILLFIILRPFINAFERFKLTTLIALAIVYTTPWDNYIVYNKAWWYRKDAVLATIGYVPIEEYMFFVIQTIMSTLWTMLCMRWSLSSLHLKHENSFHFYSIRYSVMALVTGLIVWGWLNANPGTKTFYMGSICWWALLVVFGLWYGAGNYAFRRRYAVALSVLVPTAYLCAVDLVALRDGVWHINEKTSFEIFFFDDLPIEEATFFLITNTIVVLGSCAFDKSQAVIDTYYTHLFPNGTKVTDANCSFWEYISTSMIGFTTSEIDLPAETIEDLEASIKVLDKASKSFSFAANVFSNDVKHDLTILYAFCRVTDDMIDRETETNERRKQLAIMTKFLDQLFSDRETSANSYFGWQTKPNPKGTSRDQIDWPYFQEHLTADQLAAFRSISRITHYLPQEPFYELAEGYKWDIEGRLIENEEELKLYSSYVASSVATLCTFIVCTRSNYWPDNFGKKCEDMIEHARNMGMVLQMVNISRDIITDSETLGRCYVPLNFIEDGEIKYLVHERCPGKIDNLRLKLYAEKILTLADGLARKALVGVKSLPVDNQRGILTALEIYQGIGKAIRNSDVYERRTRLGTLAKVFIFFKCMYICKL